MTRLASFLITAFVLAACARVALQFIGHDLGFDEAYILQAVDSLVGTRRYASFGVARGFGPWDFDPNLTTGPTLTLPLAPLWWVTSGSLVAVRLFMLAILLAYGAGLVVLTRGMSLRWALSGVVLLPAIFVASTHLGEALGELPGSALFVWAFVALRSGRFRVAACLVGLTVQAKLVFVTMALIVLVPVFWSLLRARQVTRTEVVRLIGLVSLPTMLFELWRLVSLGGVSGYRRSIDELRAYVTEQNVNMLGGWTSGGRHLLKWNNFVALLPGAMWLLILLSSLVGLYGILNRRVRRGGGRPLETIDYALIGAVVSGIVMFLGWWTQSVQDPARQVLAVVLVAVPALFLFAARVVSMSPRRVSIALTPVAAALILFAFTSALAGSWKVDSNPVSRTQQEVLGLVRDEEVTSILASGWYQFPELQLLTRVPAVQWIQPSGQVAILDKQFRDGGDVADADFLNGCESILLRRPDIVVCRPRVPEYSELDDLTVVLWGERDVRLGETSNPQRNGFAGLWIIIQPEDPVALRAIQVLIDGSQVQVGEISDDGTVITALVPPSTYRTPGQHVIELRNAITGQLIPVGKFTL